MDCCILGSSNSPHLILLYISNSSIPNCSFCIFGSLDFSKIFNFLLRGIHWYDKKMQKKNLKIQGYTCPYKLYVGFLYKMRYPNTHMPWGMPNCVSLLLLCYCWLHYVLCCSVENDGYTFLPSNRSFLPDLRNRSGPIDRMPSIDLLPGRRRKRSFPFFRRKNIKGRSFLFPSP